MEGDEYPLEALKILRLSRNKIHSLHKDLFDHTSRIEELVLSYNPLKVIDQTTELAIGTLMQLKMLDLSYCKLKDLPENFLHTPKFLEYLNLAGNEFTKVPSTLQASHLLSTLVISDNPIVNLTAQK